MATGGRYYRPHEEPTKEDIIAAVVNDFAENQVKASGCVTYIVITLMGLATLASALVVGIKWA